MTSTGKFIVGIEMSTNMFGFLKPLLKQALYEYLEFPTNDNWNDIYSMVIGSGRISTVWQAVLAVDPTFPNKIPASAYEDDNIIWSRIPEPELFIKALNYVFAERIKKQNLLLN